MEQQELEDMSLSRLFTLIDLDKLFDESKEYGAKIINNDTLVDRKLSKSFTDAIYSNADGEIGFVPTCPCGQTRGVMNEGRICPFCGKPVSSQFIDTLRHIAWLGIPKTMAPVLHPVWYLVLRNWTQIGRKSNGALIDIILNSDLEVPDDFVSFIPDQAHRGFKYVYENMDTILHELLYEYPRTAKKPQAKWVEQFYNVYRDKMFTRKLPILHNSLHPLKSNGSTLKYVDSTSPEILSAIIDLSAETFKQHGATVSERQFNRTLFDIYQKVITYYEDLVHNKLGRKPALLRKHCFGSRIHFSFRTVVTPQFEVKPLDEVIIPWGIALNDFKLPILNYLTHKKFLSEAEAERRWNEALLKYDPLIDEAAQAFLDGFPNHRIPILLGRNPTPKWARN